MKKSSRVSEIQISEPKGILVISSVSRFLVKEHEIKNKVPSSPPNKFKIRIPLGKRL